MNLINKIKNYYYRAYRMGHFPSVLSVLFSSKKKLIYYGFLGDGNFGDELVYNATKHLFKDQLVIPYQRHMPILIKLWCIYSSKKVDGVIVGGGTLLRKFNADKNFYLKLSNLSKPLFFHGTGVDASTLDISYWQELIKTTPFGGVRGPLSVAKSTIRNYRLSEVGDAAFYFFKSLRKEIVKKDNIILINYGTHSYDKLLNISRSEIEKFLVSDFAKNFKIKFLPYHNIDVELAFELIKKFSNIEVLDIPETYEEALKYHRNSIFTIGERLHFNVMSVMANTPFLSVNYDEKHLDFLESINSSSFGLEPKSITKEIIVDFFKNKEIRYNWKLINEKIENSVNKQKEEKNKFVNQLD